MPNATSLGNTGVVIARYAALLATACGASDLSTAIPALSPLP